MADHPPVAKKTEKVKTYPEFHKAFTHLLDISIAILDRLDNYKLVGEGSRSTYIEKIRNWTKTYQRCYGHAKPNQRRIFVVHFETIYKNHRETILNGLSDMRWVSDNKNEIRLVFNQSPYVGLHLTSIFQLSLELRDAADKSLEGVDNYDEKYDSCKEIFYTDQIILCLFRIFHAIQTDDDDQMKLLATISHLEISLQEEPEVDNGFSSGLAGLTKTAISIMKEAGITPEGAGDVDENRIGEAIGGIFGDEGAKSVLTGIFNKVKDCQSLPELVTTLVSGLNDPNLAKAVEKQVDEGAVERGEVAPTLNENLFGDNSAESAETRGPPRAKTSQTAQSNSSKPPMITNHPPMAKVISSSQSDTVIIASDDSVVVVAENQDDSKS